MNPTKALRVDPGSKVTLKDKAANDTFGVERADAEREFARDLERIEDLQYRLYAEGKRSVLVVLQGMDAAGKSGTIKSVFGPITPQGVQVRAFGKPTSNELAHNYLWRVHERLPRRGRIGVFDRSHYEDVLIVRVENLVDKQVWSRRYEHINAFEKLLVDEGTTVLKFFLHVSADEQLERLQDRVRDPRKAWKYNAYDWAKREKRGEFVEAYEVALEKCSKDHAPWFVIPADRKWFRNFAITKIVADAMEAMDPQLPKLDADPEDVARHLAETK